MGAWRKWSRAGSRPCMRRGQWHALRLLVRLLEASYALHAKQCCAPLPARTCRKGLGVGTVSGHACCQLFGKCCSGAVGWCVTTWAPPIVPQLADGLPNGPADSSTQVQQQQQAGAARMAGARRYVSLPLAVPAAARLLFICCRWRCSGNGLQATRHGQPGVLGSQGSALAHIRPYTEGRRSWVARSLASTAGGTCVKGPGTQSTCAFMDAHAMSGVASAAQMLS